jgi:hypothetical protein
MPHRGTSEIERLKRSALGAGCLATQVFDFGTAGYGPTDVEHCVVITPFVLVAFTRPDSGAFLLPPLTLWWLLGRLESPTLL